MTEVKSSRLALCAVLCVAGVVLLSLGGIAFCFSVANAGHNLEQKVMRVERRATDAATKCLEGAQTPRSVEDGDFRALLPLLTSLTLAQFEGEVLGQSERLAVAMQVRYPGIHVSTHKFLLGAVSACRETVSFKEVQQAAQNLVVWYSQDVLIERPIRSSFPTPQLTTVDRLTGARVAGATAIEALGKVVTLDELVWALETAPASVQSVTAK